MNCQYCKKEIVPKYAWRTGQKYCTIVCQQAHRQQLWVERWKDGKETGKKGKYAISGRIRRYLHEKHNNKCSKCGWGEINPTTNKTPLEINHINGDWKDNREGNLELICPNCHALTSTYKALNIKGKGRYANGAPNPVYSRI